MLDILLKLNKILIFIIIFPTLIYSADIDFYKKNVFKSKFSYFEQNFLYHINKPPISGQDPFFYEIPYKNFLQCQPFLGDFISSKPLSPIGSNKNNVKTINPTKIGYHEHKITSINANILYAMPHSFYEKDKTQYTYRPSSEQGFTEVSLHNRNFLNITMNFDAPLPVLKETNRYYNLLP